MEISWWMVRIIFSTEGAKISSPRGKHHYLYPPPGTKCMGPFQTYFPTTKPEPQGWHPDFFKNIYDEITLKLTASIKKQCNILPNYHHINPSKLLLHLLLPSVGELFYNKACQTYIIIYRELYKAIPNAIIRPTLPLVYKYILHVIMEDYIWRIIEHVLRKIYPHLGGKVEDLQKIDLWSARNIFSTYGIFYQHIRYPT